jgi:hypothetical protein
LGAHHSTINEDIGGNPPRTQRNASETVPPEKVGGGNPPAPPSLSGEAAAQAAMQKAAQVERNQEKREAAGERGLAPRSPSRYPRRYHPNLGAKQMVNESPFPLIRREHYDAFVAIPTADIPKTFDEWQKRLANTRAEFIQTGTTIVSIEIHPDEFADFCTQRGIPADLKAIECIHRRKILG